MLQDSHCWSPKDLSKSKLLHKDGSWERFEDYADTKNNKLNTYKEYL